MREPVPLARCVPERRPAPIRASDTLTVDPTLYRGHIGWVAVSRALPGGFAGFSSDSKTGGLLIRLVDTTAIDTVRKALAPLIADKPPYRSQSIRPDQLAIARAQHVRWSIAELYDWTDYLMRSVPWRADGRLLISGMGVNDRLNTVVIGAVDSTAHERVRLLLADLGLPCQLVATEVTGPSVLSHNIR